MKYTFTLNKKHYLYYDEKKEIFCSCTVIFSYFDHKLVKERDTTCLDKLCVNFSKNSYTASVPDLNLSDHLGQLLECHLGGDSVGFKQVKKVCRPITQIGLRIFHDNVAVSE